MSKRFRDQKTAPVGLHALAQPLVDALHAELREVTTELRDLRLAIVNDERTNCEPVPQDDGTVLLHDGSNDWCAGCAGLRSLSAGLARAARQ